MLLAYIISLESHHPNTVSSYYFNGQCVSQAMSLHLHTSNVEIIITDGEAHRHMITKRYTSIRKP